MPKASGSVFECGAPHQASQHRLNVTMPRLMVPHVSAASSVDPGAPASPTVLSSTIVIPVCIHSKVGPVLGCGGGFGLPAPAIGRVCKRPTGGRPHVFAYISIRRHCGGRCVFRLD